MRKAIAIDFDGCLCTDAFPAIGEPNWAVINRAKAEQQAGAGLILWTCREGQLLLDAIATCKGWGLNFDSVNESLPDWIEAFRNQPRKVGATEYWDDKAVQLPAVPIGPLPPMKRLTSREPRSSGLPGVSCVHFRGGDMTKEETIGRISDHMEVHKIGEYPHIKLAVALNMALNALRAQQAKLDRSWWEGCPVCAKNGCETCRYTYSTW